jgi:NAD(P)-dependent dehydrogenase (short-subunit alcohol dehydrogenase family)
VTGPSPATYPAAGDATADMHGRSCVVTGATRGIGRATTVGLARLGAEVIMLGRDEQRLERVREDTRRVTGNDRVSWVRADFASLDSVRRAAVEIVQRWPALHVLVNNAGINSRARARSADGHELTFAVNHLAPFLLTSLLRPSLARGAPSRVVNVVSVFAHLGRIDVSDPGFERRRYDATRAYNQSKLANVMFTLELADRLRDAGITANGVSPGLVATDLMREHGLFTVPWLRPVWRRVLLTPEQAAERVLRVATSPALAGVTAQLFAGSERPAAVPRRARDVDARRRLWELSAELTGAVPLAPIPSPR